MSQEMCAISVCVRSMVSRGMCTIPDLFKECAQTLKNQATMGYGKNPAIHERLLYT